MVWGSFSAFSVSNLAVLKDRQNIECYLKVMEDYLLLFTNDKMPVFWIYQQNDAPIHVSSRSKVWFESNGIRVTGWPARSSDFGPIENIWLWSSRVVYQNN